MRKLLNRFYYAEEGAALVEYGLLLGLIAGVCMVAVQALGTNISSMMAQLAGGLFPTAGASL